jgi:hypothetical protein
MANVTKKNIPTPPEEYTAILKRAWDKAWLPIMHELVQELKQI